MAEEQPTTSSHVELAREITPSLILPLQSSIDDLLTRLDELQSVMESVRRDAESGAADLSQIAAQRETLFRLCKRIDDLERFVEIVKRNVDRLERQVSVAETELNIPSRRISSLLKSISLFGRRSAEPETNLDTQGNYTPPDLFKTSDYFSEAADDTHTTCEGGVEEGEDPLADGLDEEQLASLLADL